MTSPAGPSDNDATGDVKPSTLSSSSSEDPAVQLCSSGLLSRLDPAVSGLDKRMADLSGRQIEVGDRISAECDKFRRAEEQFQLRAMVDKTKRYHMKVLALKEEMAAVQDRSARLTQRAVALMEEKQKEALGKEHKRQKEHDREEELVAKPAGSTK